MDQTSIVVSIEVEISEGNDFGDGALLKTKQ